MFPGLGTLEKTYSPGIPVHHLLMDHSGSPEKQQNVRGQRVNEKRKREREKRKKTMIASPVSV
jgi:hypothetical protein